MTITKENYKEIIWDKNISDDDYFEFFNTLDEQEQVIFIKFLLEHYPEYDEHWIEYYFNFSDTWVEQRAWQQFIDFADLVRSKSPAQYEERFHLLDRYPAYYAIYHREEDLLKRSFAKSVESPEQAIDDSLRSVFTLLSTDRYFERYTKEVAEKVWQPLAESQVLIGHAERHYVSFLYSQHLEELFDQIAAKSSVDWEVFKKQLGDLGFRYMESFELLPELVVSFDNERMAKDATYREEKQMMMFVVAAFDIYTTYGIPVYWVYRTFFDTFTYMLTKENAPEREYWLAFTPNMIHGLLHNLYGFLGENKETSFVVIWTLPYLYEHFFKKAYFPETTYRRLLEYYDHIRRYFFKSTNRDLWKYKALYDWKKPNSIPEDVFTSEREIVVTSIDCTIEETKEKIRIYHESLPSLPDYVEPKREPSLMEKLMRQNSGTSISTSSSSGSTRKLRKKKPRKKKHKDNRKRGGRKNKRK